MSRRVLLKLSGESLAKPGEQGICSAYLDRVSQEIACAQQQGVQIAIVVGAGNFVRGADLKDSSVQPASADQMGMLATVLNALALQDGLIAQGCNVLAMSAVGIPSVIPAFDHRQALSALDSGSVVVCAGGTGNPFVTTDSGASLRAVMLKADELLKATKVDGIYDKDPIQYSDAVKFAHLTFEEVVAKELSVMDLGAFVQCRDYGIPIRVFDMAPSGALSKALQGEPVGTLVTTH